MPPKKLITPAARRPPNIWGVLDDFGSSFVPCAIRWMILSKSLALLMGVLSAVDYLRDARFRQIKLLCQFREAMSFFTEDKY